MMSHDEGSIEDRSVPTTRDILRTAPIPEIPRESWDAFAGSYQIVEHVGAGNTGRVYKAIAGHLSKGSEVRFVAVKALGPMIDSLQEAHTGSEINHTNIASAIDAGMWRGTTFVVSEWVEPEPGHKAPRTLDTWADGRSPRAVVEACLGILDGLSLLHARLIAHRDIKASNVIVAADGTLKLVDFGMAGPSNSASGDIALFQRMLRQAIPERPIDLDRILNHPDYRGADALAADLRRWLAHEPIPWTRPGLPKRLHLFARREPVLVIVAFAAALLLATSVTLGVRYEYSRLIHEAEQARHEQEVAHERQLREAESQAYANQAAMLVRFVRKSMGDRWDREYLPIMAAFDVALGRETYKRPPDLDFMQRSLPDARRQSLWELRKTQTRERLSDGVQGVEELALQLALARWELEDGRRDVAVEILQDNLRGWLAVAETDPVVEEVRHLLASLDDPR